MNNKHKFDHEKARELHAAGMNMQAIANELGASRTSIRRAVDPTYKQNQREWQKKHRQNQTEKRPLKYAYGIEPKYPWIPVSISLNKEHAKLIDTEAMRRETSRAAIIREAIEDWLTKNEIKKPTSKGWRHMLERAGKLAPPGMPGPIQIIPNKGPHTQFYVDIQTIKALVVLRLIGYEPEYGPNANVYMPIGEADAAKVRSWLGKQP